MRVNSSAGQFSNSIFLFSSFENLTKAPQAVLGINSSKAFPY